MWSGANDAAVDTDGADPSVTVELRTGDEVPLDVLVPTWRILEMLTEHARVDLKLFLFMPRHEMLYSTTLLLKAVGILDESGHLPVVVEQIVTACAAKPHGPEWVLPAEGWPTRWTW